MGRHREYWRKNLTITAMALFGWLVLTVAFGHLGGKAALALYVAIIGFYAWYMSRLDRSFALLERDNEDR